MKFPKFSAALLAVVAPVAVAGALSLSVAPASAAVHGAKPQATSACGHKCFDLSSLQLGPGYIQDKSNTKAGRVILRIASNTFTNEDFIDQADGTVGDYCAPAGTTPSAQQFASTSYICQNYSGFPVFEANFAPDTNETDLCAGVSAPNTAGANVKMIACGETTATLWIADIGDGTWHHGHFYTPWINGGDATFSHPEVMTLNMGTKPADELQLEPENTTGSALPLTQEFTTVQGPAS